MEKVIWLMPLCVKTARCCRHLGKYFKRLRLQSLVGKAEAAPPGPRSNGAPSAATVHAPVEKGAAPRHAAPTIVLDQGPFRNQPVPVSCQVHQFVDRIG